MDPREIPQLSNSTVIPDDMSADNDEPPEQSRMAFWTTPKARNSSSYSRALPPAYTRRESLLTRQLHIENEHSDEDRIVTSPIRGLSTVSTWSASTAELTSDDGRSMPSPAISPPLLPTSLQNILPLSDKPLVTEPKIIGLDKVSKDPVETGLGRKRCITFACGNKEKIADADKPVEVKQEIVATPPKRKCALRFVCPSKSTQVGGTSPKSSARRSGSPSPKHRRSSSSSKSKQSVAGSDSMAATPTSPKASRKHLAALEASSKAASPIRTKSTSTPLLDNSDDSGAEATRFHEFATSDDEPDEWTQESTCYRNRLCVADTLKKESVIRKLGEEVEEEALDEEDEEDEDDEDQDDAVEDENDDDDDDADQDENEEDDEENESDAGFRSDDEEGFAVSDSEEDGSDNEWWTPGRLSTAATSAEHLDQLNKLPAQPDDDTYASSFASMSSTNAGPRRPRTFRTHSKTDALDIERPGTPDLPDSTDFVCGTLDEDRPREQAYINRLKEREAAKHRLIPQDIDPTFPTSDPEMDEEDDEDLADATSSGNEAMMHGSLDSIHGTARRVSPTPRRGSVRQRSPLPARHRSPAPVRAKSPAPIRHKSPAPVRHKSPAPAARAKSPAPKARVGRRSSPAPVARARSPAPRKLFGQSPTRLRSPPAPSTRMTSPPNTRRASPSAFMVSAHGLAQRPNTLTVATSLPKRPGGFLLSRMSTFSDVESEDTVAPSQHHMRGGRRRGAIDIVKGLEKKKQRRREKLAQKLAAKAAARGEERKKVKPGRGYERMKELGLELQKHKVGAGHILSY